MSRVFANGGEPKQSTVSMDKLWTPSAARVEQATITDFARAHGFAPSDYHALWRWSVDRRNVFWRALWDYAGVIGEPGDRIHSARQKTSRRSTDHRHSAW